MIEDTVLLKTTPENFLNWIENYWNKYEYQKFPEGSRLFLGGGDWMQIRGQKYPGKSFKIAAILGEEDGGEEGGGGEGGGGEGGGGENKKRGSVYDIGNVVGFDVFAINQELCEMQGWCSLESLDTIYLYLILQIRKVFPMVKPKAEQTEAARAPEEPSIITPTSKDLLDKACIQWAGRDRSPHVEMSDFLRNFNNKEFETSKGMDWIIEAQFKEGLKDAYRRKLIKKVNGRYRL